MRNLYFNCIIYLLSILLLILELEIFMEKNPLFARFYKRSPDCTVSRGCTVCEQKPECFQTLENHLLGTAKLAEIFGNNLGFGQLAYLAGLLHDAGKATEEWQQYLFDSIMEEKAVKKQDHSSIGALLSDLYIEKMTLPKIIVQAAVMYHHGSGLPDFLSLDGTTPFSERLNKKSNAIDIFKIESRLPMTVCRDIKQYFCDGSINDFGESFIRQCKSGCIFRDNTIDKKKFLFNMGMHLRQFSSCLIDADRIDSRNFESEKSITDKPCIPQWEIMLNKLESALSLFPPSGKISEIRKNLSDRCAAYGKKAKGIYTCSAMTGSGKTLASLRFALEQAKLYHMKRIIIIAPYTSIIDQNARIIRSILENNDEGGRIVFECHSNIAFNTGQETIDSIDDYTEFENSWNAPIIITTMVQFLEALFASGTKSIRRMHNIEDSVLVFDEIQTLPLKCIYLFNWALDYLVKCCSCSALLCTATQPCLDKIGEDRFHLRLDGEIIENAQFHFRELQRVVFSDKSKGGRLKVLPKDVCSYISEQMDFCSNFLAVVNTKSQARELFELVKNSGCADSVYHLSTNMCPIHRKEVIDTIKNELSFHRRIVCISTRLIEAGIDLSFDGALRYMAGLDSVIQTAGRCNRNGDLTDGSGKPVRGHVALFSIQNENLSSLEEVKIGQKCMERILREKETEDDYSLENLNLICPEIIRRYFLYYYQQFSKKLAYPVLNGSFSLIDLLSDNGTAVEEYKRIHERHCYPLPFVQSFKTAGEHFEVIADATAGIIVPYNFNSIAGHLSALEKGDENFTDSLKNLLCEAQQFSVNVYKNQLEKLKKENMIYEVIPDSGIYALFEEYYNPEQGLNFENFCGNAEILAY